MLLVVQSRFSDYKIFLVFWYFRKGISMFWVFPFVLFILMIFQFKENIKRENQRKGKHVFVAFDFFDFFDVFVFFSMYKMICTCRK